MFVPTLDGRRTVYFAYPKCASEYIRYGLNLTFCIDHSKPFKWEACRIDYCHAKPSLFIQHHGIGTSDQMFTITRNPFARLVSLWIYGTKQKLPYVQRTRTFTEFVRMLHQKRDRLLTLPMGWMVLPFEDYFEDVPLTQCRVFKMEEMPKVIAFIQEHTGTLLESKPINTTEHAHYSTYYTEETRALVEDLYAWEIHAFDYRFEKPSDVTQVVKIES